MKSGFIYVPVKYAQHIRSAKKKGDRYSVNKLWRNDFFNIKALNEQLQVILNSLKISEVKVLKIVQNNLNKLFIKEQNECSR